MKYPLSGILLLLGNKMGLSFRLAGLEWWFFVNVFLACGWLTVRGDGRKLAFIVVFLVQEKLCDQTSLVLVG